MKPWFMLVIGLLAGAFASGQEADPAQESPNPPPAANPAEQVKELIVHLDDKNPVMRYQAARSLLLMGPDAKDAVPKLIEKLSKDQDEPARAAYAEALGIIGPVSKEVIPALIDGLEDEASYVRYSAATALARFGDKAKPAVPALVKKFQASEGSDREVLASTFGKIGPAAAEALPALEESLGNRRSV